MPRNPKHIIKNIKPTH